MSTGYGRAFVKLETLPDQSPERLEAAQVGLSPGKNALMNESGCPNANSTSYFRRR